MCAVLTKVCPWQCAVCLLSSLFIALMHGKLSAKVSFISWKKEQLARCNITVSAANIPQCITDTQLYFCYFCPCRAPSALQRSIAPGKLKEKRG